MDRAFRGVLAAVLLLTAAVVPAALLTDRPIWAVDAVVLGTAYYLVYRLRRTLVLTPVLFAMLGLLVLAHCWSVLGMFGMSFFGLEWDTYIHTYSNFVVGLMAYRYMGKFETGGLERLVAAFLLVLGVGLTNELVEFVGYRIGGEGEGLFLLGPGDIGATNAFENLMTDFLYDTLGALAGLAAGFAAWRDQAPGL
ncbi:MAG: hypothetical protein R6W82_01905 [bacterium]